MEHERLYRQVAMSCWQMIKAISPPPGEESQEADLAAINLIEMACESAAESQRVALGYPPRGAT